MPSPMPSYKQLVPGGCMYSTFPGQYYSLPSSCQGAGAWLPQLGNAGGCTMTATHRLIPPVTPHVRTATPASALPCRNASVCCSPGKRSCNPGTDKSLSLAWLEHIPPVCTGFFQPSVLQGLPLISRSLHHDIQSIAPVTCQLPCTKSESLLLAHVAMAPTTLTFAMPGTLPACMHRLVAAIGCAQRLRSHLRHLITS